MSRLVRLLSAGTALHSLARSRFTLGLRARHGISDAFAPPAPASEPLYFAPGTASGGKRTAAARVVTAASAMSSTRGTVRVYRGASGTTMVGKIDAICRMIDRCIADESASRRVSGNEASRSI